jgi:hypothetical protein
MLKNGLSEQDALNRSISVLVHPEWINKEDNEPLIRYMFSKKKEIVFAGVVTSMRK